MKTSEAVAEFELEADHHSSMAAGAPQAVRKSIALTLKKPKSAKSKGSGLTKKEKKAAKEKRSEAAAGVAVEDGTTAAVAGDKRSRKQEKRKEVESDDREDEELDWSHKVMFAGEKVQNPMIHICEQCSFPILVYGRISPCKHVFCLACAQKAGVKCPRCEELMERIEPAGIGHIFMCMFGGPRNSSAGCRRSYLSQRDLIAHIRHRHERDITDAELMKQAAAPIRMPFFAPPPGMMLPPPPPPNMLPGVAVSSGGSAASPVQLIGAAGPRPFLAAPVYGPAFATAPQIGLPPGHSFAAAAAVSHPTSVPQQFQVGAPPVAAAAAGISSRPPSELSWRTQQGRLPQEWTTRQ